MDTNQGGADNSGADSELTFEHLVNAARSGDSDAVGALLDKYRGYLMLIANQDVTPELKTKMGASDVVQESMMHAQANFQQFHGESETQFKAWLKTILANDIKKGHRHYRMQKRNANLEVNMQEQSAVGRGLTDEQLTPSSKAIEEEKAKALEIAMKQLSAEQQQVIQLRNFERLSFAEIAERMERSEDAARKFWARSIEALKMRLIPANDSIVKDDQ